MAATAGTAHRVTFSYNVSPAISPDGRYMSYIDMVDGAYRVHFIDLVCKL